MRQRPGLTLITGICLFFSTGSAWTDSPKSEVNQFNLRNGDIVAGYVLRSESATLHVKVERLLIAQRNVQKATERLGVTTLFHKDGTVFTGKFRVLSAGDYFLNEPLFPESFAVEKTQIDRVSAMPAQVAAGSANSTPGFVIARGNLRIFFDPTGNLVENAAAEKYSAPRNEAQSSAADNFHSLLQLRAGFFPVVSDIRRLFPAVWSAQAAYAHDLDFLTRRRSAWLPWLSGEAGILYAENAPYGLSGGYVSAGMLWAVPLSATHYASAGVAAGMNFLSVHDARLSDAHRSVNISTSLSYGYRFFEWVALLSVALNFVYDDITPLNAIGISIGVGRFFGI